MTEKRALTIAAALLESDEWKFSSVLGNDNMYLGGTEDFDYSGSLRIDWEAVCELRDWGIKDITIQVHHVHLDLDGEDPETYAVKKIVADWPQPAEKRPTGTTENPTDDLATYMARPPEWTVKWKWRINPEHEWLSVAPSHADIDLRRRTIEIEF